jgi:hypothetical protein
MLNQKQLLKDFMVKRSVAELSMSAKQDQEKKDLAEAEIVIPILVAEAEIVAVPGNF